MSAEDIEYMSDYKEFPTKESALDWLDNYLSLDERNNLIKALEQEPVLDKIRAEIMDCLKALDDIEKSGFNIYLSNEMTGRRLTYQQCLEFIDKYKEYKAESEDNNADSN